MLLLAKLAGIAVLVWFFLTAREHGEQPVKWAVIGLMGYWITWWAVKLSVVNLLAGLVAKSAIGTFLLTQIPAVVGVCAAYFIRKKLLSDAAATEKN
ncbi:MAG: hypothetical protein M8364_11145 [Methylobacter sp.]|jgi:hypothetical protein|uniref:hypothetical protein n=1 Tax=Methylobacter TaxID=429 RepID=UPI0003678859|nr:MULTISPECIES: hypothetical protein [Methylobacter]MCL7421447.1 hypothetical protein [Methylobacter sp.]